MIHFLKFEPTGLSFFSKRVKAGMLAWQFAVNPLTTTNNPLLNSCLVFCYLDCRKLSRLVTYFSYNYYVCMARTMFLLRICMIYLSCVNPKLGGVRIYTNLCQPVIKSAISEWRNQGVIINSRFRCVLTFIYLCCFRTNT